MSKWWKWNSQAAANRPSQKPGPGSDPDRVGVGSEGTEADSDYQNMRIFSALQAAMALN
jgi:hypothetical protein